MALNVLTEEENRKLHLLIEYVYRWTLSSGLKYTKSYNMFFHTKKKISNIMMKRMSH